MSEEVTAYPEKIERIRDYTRQIRWHKRHLRTITAKLSAEEYEAFKAICEARCSTPYAVLCTLVREYMREATHGFCRRGRRGRRA